MKIYQIEFQLAEMSEIDPEKIRAHVMSCFNDNRLIGAIATAAIIGGSDFILFKFLKPVILSVPDWGNEK